MDTFEEAYREIFGSIIGDSSFQMDTPATQSVWETDSKYKRAYQQIWKARENLCSRFQLEWEDRDLEQIMFAVIDLEEDIARRMYYATLEYAQRGYRLYK